RFYLNANFNLGPNLSPNLNLHLNLNLLWRTPVSWSRRGATPPFSVVRSAGKDPVVSQTLRKPIESPPAGRCPSTFLQRGMTARGRPALHLDHELVEAERLAFRNEGQQVGVHAVDAHAAREAERRLLLEPDDPAIAISFQHAE